MATKQESVFYTLLNLREKMTGISEDIKFLKACLKEGVTPISHRVGIKSSLPGAEGQRTLIEKNLIKISIKGLYKKLAEVTLKAYHTHLKLGKDNNKGDMNTMILKIARAVECEQQRKRRIHQGKLENLRENKRTLIRHTETNEEQKPKVELIPDFVVNKSKTVFSNDEMEVLNKGLNFAIKGNMPVDDIVVDLETGIRNLTQGEKDNIRTGITSELKRHQSAKYNFTQEQRIIKQLKEKPVYYLKADKGNKVVIIDKSEYDKVTYEKLASGNYIELRKDPLPDSIKRVEKALKEASATFENIGRLKMPNPSLPRIRCQPKIHKGGNEMREIIADTNSPTYNIAKWLVTEIGNMEKEISKRSLKNTADLIQKIQGISLEEDERLVSFDVKNLFPSIPVKEALWILEEWLEGENATGEWKKRVRQYTRLAALCMNENYFTFRGRYFKTKAGTAMGNPLSPLISEIFMAHFEKKMDNLKITPRIWWRYVDDVIAVVKEKEITTIWEKINAIHKNIKFTMEGEINNQLPFLDLIIKRKDKHLEFGIYRKTTSTQRTITNDSNHSYQHKMAAYNTMVHRLITTPMDQQEYNKERSYIIDTARINGYSPKLIEHIISKKLKKMAQEEMTTLFTQNRKDEIKKRIAVPHSTLTNKIKKMLKKHEIEVVMYSRQHQLKIMLGSPKDRKKKEEASGIYKITCAQCQKTYIGQTKRLITTRLKEHLKEAETTLKKNRSNETIRSSVAKHIIMEKHTIGENNLELVKEVNKFYKLDAYESLAISRIPPETRLNSDVGNNYSPLMEITRRN